MVIKITLINSCQFKNHDIMNKRSSWYKNCYAFFPFNRGQFSKLYVLLDCAVTADFVGGSCVHKRRKQRNEVETDTKEEKIDLMGRQVTEVVAVEFEVFQIVFCLTILYTYNIQTFLSTSSSLYATLFVPSAQFQIVPPPFIFPFHTLHFIKVKFNFCATSLKGIKQVFPTMCFKIMYDNKMIFLVLKSYRYITL